MRCIGPLATCVLALLTSGPVASMSSREAETQRALRDAERTGSDQLAAHKDAAERAAHAASASLQLARKRVEAAAKLRQAEAATAEIAAKIDVLAQRRQDADQRVQARAKDMQPLLPLIERLSLYPAETLLAVPAAPDTALRGVLVLQGLSRQIEIETEALRRDQAEVDFGFCRLAARRTPPERRRDAAEA